MIPIRGSTFPAPWRRAMIFASVVHALALGWLFVRISPSPVQNNALPAIAVEMASPAALPAPIHDAPTPRQVEAPRQIVRMQPEPRKVPFDPPPETKLADAKAEVVLPLKKVDTPPTEKANPLPPAPTTTQAAAPDLKQDVKTTAMLTGGASAGKAGPADIWDARVRARIELTKRYPGLATRQHQQDNVDVVLTIDRGGRLLDARVRTSAGFAMLNDAALDAVRRAAPFPKPPKEVEGDPVKIAVIVRFFERAARD
uniref:energy transducer TonB n=1 Tax=uncultured Sphingomonas sp. TaxID=158754 RepID=UPI0035C99C6E